MRKLVLVVLVAMLAASFAYADCGNCGSSCSKDPVTGTIDATGKFVGTVASVVTGEKESSVTVADSNGATKVFPIDQATKIVDATLNIATLGQLKAGDKVAVDYAKDASGKEAAKAIVVTK